MNRDSLEEDYEFEVIKTDEGGYSISLPHQCDSWEILGADLNLGWEIKNEDFTGGYLNFPKNKELAIKQMELFIKRAQEALNKLKEL